MWQSFCKVIGRPELVDDPRFKENADRVKHIEELTSIVEDFTSKRSKQEVMRLMGEAGVPYGPLLDTAEVLNCPPLHQPGMLHPRDHPAPRQFPIPVSPNHPS